MRLSAAFEALADASGYEVWSQADEFVAARDGLARYFATLASLRTFLEEQKEQLHTSSKIYKDLLRAATLTESDGEHVLVVRPNGRVVPIPSTGTPEHWSRREVEPQSIIREHEGPQHPIALEVVQQQAKDLGGRVVDRDEFLKEVYLPVERVQGYPTEQRTVFRTLEEVSAFLAGVAQRKAQFG